MAVLEGLRPGGMRAPALPVRGRLGAGPSRAGTRERRPSPLEVTRERHAPDWIVLVVVLGLTAIGILMVYSSSAMKAYVGGDGTFAVVGTQLQWAVLGIAALLAFQRIDYRWLRLVSVPGVIVAVVLLVLDLVSPWRLIVGGSAQWLKLPGLPAVQPGEFVKLALIIYLAHWMARRGAAVHGIRGGLLPFCAIVGPFVLLILKTPDLGSTAVVAATAVSMLFMAGGSLPGIFAMVGSGGAIALAVLQGYQAERIQAFADPFAYQSTIGYHSVQGLLALGLGGLFGAGLGDRAAAGSIDLPNAQSDYIFAVIGQEFGFIGATVVVLGFVILAYRGVRIALAAPDTFGGLLAGGITAYLCIQALINIAVVVVLVPVTGITLPFVSAGGSSLIVSLAAVGILLSVSRETAAQGGWVDASADRSRRNGRTHLPGSRRRALTPRAPGRA